MAFRLLLGFALLILLFAVFSTVSFERSRQERQRDALDDTLHLAETASAVMYGLLRDLDTTMLAMSLALGSTGVPLTQETAAPYLGSIASRYMFIRALFLIGPDGRVLASPSGDGNGTDLSAQPYVQAMLAGQDFVLSDVLAGVQTGSPLIVLGRRVEAPNGQLRAMIAAAYYPDRLAQILPASLPPDAALDVYDRRGGLVYTSHDDAPALVNSQPGAEVIRAVLAGETITAERIEAEGGDERLIAAVPIADYGWAVSVSRDAGEIERPLERYFRGQLLALAVVTTLASALALLLSRTLAEPLATLAARARAFGHGDRAALRRVSGPSELHDLSAALNSMAAEIEARFAERDDALADARAALAVRDQFLTIAAHELRTPLTALKGNLQLAGRTLGRADGVERAAAMVARANGQVDRLTKLIGDLLDVSRLADGQIQIERRPVRIDELIRDAVETAAASAPDREYRLDLAEGETTAIADESRIEQVLINLLENAHKYSPLEAPITIALHAQAETVTIAITDRGIGVPEREQARIFERFHRSSNVDRNVSGLGLGLYIAGEIVRAHGGTLGVASGADAGSTFTVTLPRAPEAAAASSDGPDHF